MDFQFREPQRDFQSGSQRAKAWTEQWVAEHLYCPNCGNSNVMQFPANLPVADFFCARCNDQYELKSQKRPFGSKFANGAFSKKKERLMSDTNPNFILLNYSEPRRSVQDITIIPKHFFDLDVVEERKPLGPNARRAGWIGSNILVGRIPASGRIQVVKDGVAVSKDIVLSNWQKTLFLREHGVESRGWLLDVMRCVEAIGTREFELDQVYAFEAHLSSIYPANNNVRPKIRQQLQFLRDHGFIEFLSRGSYRLT